MPDWYLYIVRCRDGTLYTGIATDVSRRLEEHGGNGNKGAKYLRGRGPLRLVFKVKVGDKGLALRLELKIKRLTKAQKEELIADETSLTKEMKTSPVGTVPCGRPNKREGTSPSPTKKEPVFSKQKYQ